MEVDSALARSTGTVVFDFEKVERFDSSGMGAVIQGIRHAKAQGAEVRVRGMSPQLMDFFSLVSIARLCEDRPDPPPTEDFVTRVGGRVEPLVASFQAVSSTLVEVLACAFVWPFRGRRWRWDRIAIELEACLLGGLLIVLLIGFLLGLILAMQAYVQLRVWGADIYMADMVGVSVAYEIGPLMTGIILAARSGSSNAAQLGSMVVSEEIDALRQMGIQPVSYLILPKVLSQAFTGLALGLVFDYVAVIGGASFAYTAAGIEPNAYMERTSDALQLNSFLIASIKSVVFGAIVGVVGCGLGMRVTGGSEGVGRATTNAVVLTIFLIIVVDALFVAAQQLG